jgi:single-strand DNA-binding protein
MSKYNLKMPQINECSHSGYVCADFELKYTPKTKENPEGLSRVTFMIACDYGYGEKKTTTFWSVKAWGRTAERCASELRKGAPVVVYGKDVMEEWVSSECVEGAKKLTPTILARSVNCLAWLNEPEPDTTGADDVPF